MTGLRILHLFASPYWSGPAENIALLAAAQRELGHSVTIAVDRKRTVAVAEELITPRLEQLGLLDDGGLELSVKSSPLALMSDVRQLRSRSLDVIHSHFSHDHYLARFSRRRGTRLVRSIHAPRSLQLLLPAADAWTVPTRGLLSKVKGPAHVLQALVAPEFELPTRRAGVRETLGIGGNPLVAMVSTFQRSRRHALGVEAFAALHRSHPDARMVLIGDGELEQTVRAQVCRMGLESAITFAGYQARESFVRWCQAMDQVWVLGLGNDFSGRAAAQARACGARVLGVDEGALSDWADVIVPLDAPAIAQAAAGTERRTIEIRPNRRVAEEVVSIYAAR